MAGGAWLMETHSLAVAESNGMRQVIGGHDCTPGIQCGSLATGLR